MTLPDCLTKFDAAKFAQAEGRPKRYCEAILSRPERGITTKHGLFYWSAVPPVPCLLSREGFEDRVRDGFLVCILREFDELPQ